MITKDIATLQNYVSQRDRIIKGQKKRIKYLNEYNRILIMRFNKLKELYHIRLDNLMEDV